MKLSFKNKIGKGLFSTAYLQEDNKTVILKSIDNIKECMSLGWFPESKYFANTERIEDNIYKMKYFKKVKSLKKSLRPQQYEIYQELRKLDIGFVKNNYDRLDLWRAQFDTLKNNSIKNALHEAIDACSNYGSCVSFEISPRNVAVTNTGGLILLDCFFMQDQANKLMTKKYQ
jgi:hypothetical protein